MTFGTPVDCVVPRIGFGSFGDTGVVCGFVGSEGTKAKHAAIEAPHLVDPSTIATTNGNEEPLGFNRAGSGQDHSFVGLIIRYRVAHVLTTVDPIVVTTESLTVRRTLGGEIVVEVLPVGSRCLLVDHDDIEGTYLLIDEQEDEVWHVRPEQMELPG